MTLAEKIAALRGERKLSQGDLAEKLDVSRQSVSKWETGQAVPELEKIIKLADLFGVSVDELVREGEALQGEQTGGEGASPTGPETPPAADPTARETELETKIVYVEQRGLKGTQIFGALLLALGLICTFWSFLVSYSVGAMLSSLVAAMGLPFLLCRKHPFLIAGWVLIALSLLFLNPYTSVAPWGLLGGLQWLQTCLLAPGELNGPSYLFAAAIGIIRGTLALLLIFFTARLCRKSWKKRGQKNEKAAE